MQYKPWLIQYHLAGLLSWGFSKLIWFCLLTCLFTLHWFQIIVFVFFIGIVMLVTLMTIIDIGYISFSYLLKKLGKYHG